MFPSVDTDKWVKINETFLQHFYQNYPEFIKRYIQLNGTTMGQRYDPTYTDIAMSFHDSTLQQLLAGKILSLDPNRIPNSARVNSNADINGNININHDNSNSNSDSNSNNNNSISKNDFHISNDSITNLINNVHNNDFNNVFHENKSIPTTSDNNDNSNIHKPTNNPINKSKRRDKIINKLKKKHVNFDKTEIVESDQDVIDDFSLGSITPDHIISVNSSIYVAKCCGLWLIT